VIERFPTSFSFFLDVSLHVVIILHLTSTLSFSQSGFEIDEYLGCRNPGIAIPFLKILYLIDEIRNKTIY